MKKRTIMAMVLGLLLTGQQGFVFAGSDDEGTPGTPVCSSGGDRHEMFGNDTQLLGAVTSQEFQVSAEEGEEVDDRGARNYFDMEGDQPTRQAAVEYDSDDEAILDELEALRKESTDNNKVIEKFFDSKFKKLQALFADVKDLTEIQKKDKNFLKKFMKNKVMLVKAGLKKKVAFLLSALKKKILVTSTQELGKLENVLVGMDDELNKETRSGQDVINVLMNTLKFVEELDKIFTQTRQDTIMGVERGKMLILTHTMRAGMIVLGGALCYFGFGQAPYFVADKFNPKSMAQLFGGLVLMGKAGYDYYADKKAK